MPTRITAATRPLACTAMENLDFFFIDDEPCTCGAEKLFGDCCKRVGIDKLMVARAPRVFPPLPKTGFSHPKCFLNTLHDCSEALSGEHYITKGILKQLPEIKFDGLPWSDGPTSVGINSLTAKILCRRHNSALSPMDDEASKLFRALAASNEHTTVGDAKPRQLQRIINGPLIELWAAKTSISLFHAHGRHPKASPAIRTASANVEMFIRQLRGQKWPPPYGLWALDTNGISRNPFELIVRTSGDNTRIVGLDFTIIGVPFSFLEPNEYLPTNNPGFRDPVYRPNLFRIVGPKGASSIIITWPPPLPHAIKPVFLTAHATPSGWPTSSTTKK